MIEAERDGWHALVSGEGAAYYREHLTDDALMAFPFGVLSWEQAIEAIESAPPWSTFEMRDPRVIVLTENSGILVYSVVAHRERQGPYSALISSAFVRREGAWKLAFHQQSPA